jgi:hypothetical protein
MVARNHSRCLSLMIRLCQIMQLKYGNYEQYRGPSLRLLGTWAGRKTNVKYKYHVPQYMYHGTHESINQLLFPVRFFF